MRYRVAFAKRYQSDGNASALDPTAELDTYLSDGVVADKVFVERFDPESKHSQDVLDEDDAFLGLAAAEVWEYDVVDENATAFEDAVRNSGVVMEIEVIDSTSTDQDELTAAPAGAVDTRSPDFADPTGGETARPLADIGDGPGATVTGDPSSEGMGPGRIYLSTAEAMSDADQPTGDLDDLNVMKAGDPRLGLTDYGNVPAEDWAADTGPGHNPGDSVEPSTLDERPSARKKSAGK